MTADDRILYLCAGLQSSGSTLISWCFLQRRDMDGYLDANNDQLAEFGRLGDSAQVWLKTTISSFRLSEQIAHYQDFGWTVRPLLICRDVREVYASLRTKEYGRNSTTAEDPPLRMRLRRFREDWDHFHDNDWPILRYDEFIDQPERTLREACVKLQLPWDAGMIAWPKRREAILDTRHGNQTFRQHCQDDLWSSVTPVKQSRKPLESLRIPAAELEWMEQEFARFNHVNNYVPHIAVPRLTAAANDQAVPTYAVSRRRKWKLQQTPLKYLLKRVTGWFHADPIASTVATPQVPAPVPMPAVAPPVPVVGGDGSRTDLGQLAATES